MSSEIAQQMHNTTRPNASEEVTKSKAKISKTDVRYWQNRVEKSAPRDGYVSPFFSVQIAFRGRRMRFPLETSVKQTAAAKAQKVYLSLLAVGWEATLKQFKPQSVKSEQIANIGQLVEEVRATAGIRSSTFSVYVQALRLIASEIAEIGDQPAMGADGALLKDKKGRPILMSRFDYKKGGRKAWVSKVDAITLSVLSSSDVQRWKLSYVEKRGTAPDARRRAVNSVNSHLRNARSLFSEKALKHVHSKLTLPSPLPFAGVSLEKRGTSRYQSKIEAPQLVADAQTELAKDPSMVQPFRIFCLAMMCGLRKREIDSLLWAQVDLNAAKINIEATEHFHPKSEDSIAAVDVDSELVALLRAWKGQRTGEFVIESKNPPRYHISRVNYRCEKDFRRLYQWLESKGISARKKLHELRKELGSILASDLGIYAAQQVLRHADIRTTQQFYTDKKKPISAGLGKLLRNNQPENVSPLSPAQLQSVGQQAKPS
ncbi:site-specific integrase [Roseimicrobium sp. ORNL1]|uniref:site-specific integrase n=1 Tax=Roseimicrobium sp. ORNL1 TaxID=2711231 RepID=UPI0013E14829|nr:site-specific integrase [Roseimicrobium sp. ORNL1]QIF02439.1 tyrosine-type recombinase/integrase [Roseimicrobium sp. ORNL1]